MKILRYDSVGGASGDMILASLIDLGADLDSIRDQVLSLGADEFTIEVESSKEDSFGGTKATVTLLKGHDHHHRHAADIRKMIYAGSLSDRVKTVSSKVFTRLAEAEARVHNTTPGEIHFHEVGAMDSIVDIVASCVAIEMLEVDGVIAGPLPVGQGTTTCAHGVIPIPVPATVEILADFPIIQTEEPFELVTPTAAALLMTWLKEYPADRSAPTSIVRTGAAIGHRKLNSRPNLLRCLLTETSAGINSDVCVVLECNIDDTVPELLGSLSQKLITNGALDVFTTAVQMKKQRPGTLLTVLCKPEDKSKCMDAIFTESTTFGIREYSTDRTILERRSETIETQYGTIRVKIGSWKGREITRAPEHDDCVTCAEKHGVAVREVYEATLRAIG